MENPDRAELNKDARPTASFPGDDNVAESKQLQELTPCCGDTSEAHTQPWTSVFPYYRRRGVAVWYL